MKECSWPGCTKKVDGWRWGCSFHWHLLPELLREKIGLGMQDALYDAQQWIKSTFGAEERREYNPGKWETLVRMVRARDEARARRRAVGKDKQ